MEVYVDDDSKLTLHGLQQHYVKLKDNEKNRKLFELLDALEFNQVIHLSPWRVEGDGRPGGCLPLPSNRRHRSNDDCLEGKRENYRVCSVQYCVQQLCMVQCTHMNRSNSCLLVRFSFSEVILCVKVFCLFSFLGLL